MADSQLHHSGPVFVQFHSHLLEERRSSTGYPVMAGVTSYQPSSPEAPQAGRRQVDTGPPRVVAVTPAAHQSSDSRETGFECKR